MWNSYSQRCEQQYQGLLGQLDEGFMLEDGGDYFELPYTEPVYEPVYEPSPEPIYFEPEPVYVAPEPVYIPPPIYQEPAPIYQPALEPVQIVLAPEPIYQSIPEPIYFEPEPIPVVYSEPVFDQPVYVEPYIESRYVEPIYEPAFESTPYVSPVESMVYQAPEPVYVEPEPEPIYFELPYVAPEPEPEPIIEEFFALPYVEPAPIEEEQIFFELPSPPIVEPVPIVEPEPVISPMLPGYVGCYADTGNRDLPYSAQMGGSDIEACKSLCAAAGYAYAGIQYGGECWCGDSYGQYGGSGDCNMPCNSNPDQICGGSWANSVYALSAPTETLSVPASTPELITEWIAEPEPFIAPTPISEPIGMYTDDFGNIVDPGYYESGVGGDSFAVDYASVYAPIDFAPEVDIEPFSFEPSLEPLVSEPPIEEISFGEFDFGPLVPPTLEPLPESPGLSSEELFFDYLDFYFQSGYDADTAIALAEQEAAAGSILIPTSEQAPLPEPLSPMLPFVPFEPIPEEFFGLPYVPFEEPSIPPPPAKLGPCDTPTGLPGPCASGTYHPIADPCACVPFPPAPTQPTQTQQPKPPTPTTAPKPPTPKPPTQQQACPATHCKHPQTGQCMLIPVGYQRHPQTQVCTPTAQQASPSTTNALDELKKVPWWVWAAGAGLLLLSQSGGGDRTTTVRYRRS